MQEIPVSLQVRDTFETKVKTSTLGEYHKAVSNRIFRGFQLSTDYLDSIEQHTLESFYYDHEGPGKPFILKQYAETVTDIIVIEVATNEYQLGFIYQDTVRYVKYLENLVLKDGATIITPTVTLGRFTHSLIAGPITASFTAYPVVRFLDSLNKTLQGNSFCIYDMKVVEV